MYLVRWLFVFIFISCFYTAYGQKDIDLALNGTYLTGKNVLKINRDYNDPYLWVLVQNNGVYRINSITKAIDDYTAKFSAYSNLNFIGIAGYNQDEVIIASDNTVIHYKSGVITQLGAAQGIPGTINSIGLGYDYLPNDVIVFIATNTGMRLYELRTETIYPSPDKLFSKILETSYRNNM
jgi:hypothetical protein